MIVRSCWGWRAAHCPQLRRTGAQVRRDGAHVGRTVLQQLLQQFPPGMVWLRQRAGSQGQTPRRSSPPPCQLLGPAGRVMPPLVARLFLVIALVCGLVPSMSETVELVVHYVQTGHLAHTEPGEADLGDESREHGCGPTAHHCGCCVSQSVMPAPLLPTLWLETDGRADIPERSQSAPEASPRRLWRPPIFA